MHLSGSCIHVSGSYSLLLSSSHWSIATPSHLDYSFLPCILHAPLLAFILPIKFVVTKHNIHLEILLWFYYDLFTRIRFCKDFVPILYFHCNTAYSKNKQSIIVSQVIWILLSKWTNSISNALINCKVSLIFHTWHKGRSGTYSHMMNNKH